MTAKPAGRPLVFLCIGDIDVDVLISVDRLPGPDGKVNGRWLERVPGGMAANVAAQLAKLGASARLFGRVGLDADGDFALEALERDGVDTRFVRRLADCRTFSCLGLVTPDGEKSLVKLMTPAYLPEASDILPELFHDVHHTHLTSVQDVELCRSVCAAAHAAGGTCSIDVERADLPEVAGEVARAIADFDLVFCNSESRAAVDAGVAALAPLGDGAIVTTLGAGGSRVETGGEVFFAPGFAVEAKDTTGAGDCFAAALLYARLATQLDWKQALRFANCAAALSTQGYGAQAAQPSWLEVQAALGR